MADNGTEHNRVLVTEAFEAWRDGRAPITAIFAPGMTWRIEGRSAASGSYGSTQAFVADVLGPFAARFPEDRPFRPSHIRRVVADDDVVVVVWDGHGDAVDGVAYDNSYVWVLQLD